MTTDSDRDATDCMSVPVTELALGRRAHNVLRRGGVCTIGEIVLAGRDGVGVLRNCGVTTVEQIFAAVAEFCGVEIDELTPARLAGLVPPGRPSTALAADAATAYAFSDAVRALSIDVLDLPSRTDLALRRSQCSTVGDVADVVASGAVTALWGIGAGGTEAIMSGLERMREHGDALAEAQRASRQAPIAAAPPPLIEIPASAAPPNLVALIAPIAREVLRRSEGADRGTDAYSVLRGRYGLEGSRRYVMQDIADALGITRQRVQQIEARALRMIRDVLSGRRGVRGAVVPPALRDEVRAVADLLESDGAVWAPTELDHFFAARYREAVGRERTGAMELVLESLGLRKRRAPSGLDIGDHYWHAADSSFSCERFETAARAVQAAFAEVDEALTSYDLLIAANRGRSARITEREIGAALRLNHRLEIVAGDEYRVRFEHLSSHARRARRVLKERGSPMRLREIVREINARLVATGQEIVPARSVHQQIFDDHRIMSTERGVWALREWGHQTVVPTGKLLADFFAIREDTASIDEIMAFVAVHRPALTRNAVQTYLYGSSRYQRVSATEWRLKRSPRDDTYVAPPRPTRSEWVRHIAAAMAALHAESGEEVGIGALVAALIERTGAPSSTCYLMASTCPVIERHGHRRQRRVTLRPLDAPETLQLVAAWEASRHTIRDDVHAAVVDLLASREDHTAPLREVAGHVRRTVGCPRATIYAYISAMRDVTKVRNGSETLCVLARGE